MHRCERRRLARTGRTGDQHEAARLLGEVLRAPTAARACSSSGSRVGISRNAAPNRGALHVGVHTEAAVPGNRVREVDLPLVLEPLALVVGEDPVDDLAGVAAASGSGSRARCSSPRMSHHRRRADGHVEVRGAELDDLLEDRLRSRIPSRSPIGIQRGTRYSRNFFNRRDAASNLVEAVLHAACASPARSPCRGSHRPRRARSSCSRISFVTIIDLVDAEPALVAGVAAARAADWPRRPPCPRGRRR